MFNIPLDASRHHPLQAANLWRFGLAKGLIRAALQDACKLAVSTRTVCSLPRHGTASSTSGKEELRFLGSIAGVCCLAATRSVTTNAPHQRWRGGVCHAKLKTWRGATVGNFAITDIIWLVNFVFKGGPPPLPCEAAGDVNCSLSSTSADIIYLVNHVFKGGPLPCDACVLIASGGWTCP